VVAKLVADELPILACVEESVAITSLGERFEAVSGTPVTIVVAVSDMLSSAFSCPVSVFHARLPCAAIRLILSPYLPDGRSTCSIDTVIPSKRFSIRLICFTCVKLWISTSGRFWIRCRDSIAPDIESGAVRSTLYIWPRADS
jgi:hypothetical protein